MRNLLWILKNPTGGRNFKLLGQQLLLQIKIPLKKLIILSFLKIQMGTLPKLNFHFKKRGSSSFFFIKCYIEQLW